MKRILTSLGFMMIAAAVFAGDVTLLGAGATFPGPLYSKMFDVYYRQKKVEVNYQAIGSGGGIQQLISRTVDFGGTDAPMNDKETKAAREAVLHFPTCLGAVVLTYNIPGSPVLNFTPELIADIFLGKISKWNDPKIAEANPGVALPNLVISVVHRSDGSGTTYTFTEYLTAVSPAWKEKIGTGKAVNWPVGLGGKGNPGVAAYVKQVPGAIGYVEAAYAKQNRMPMARVKNKSGNFVEPTIQSVGLAADVDIPGDSKVSLVNTSAPQGYPICTFTWIIVYQEQAYGGRTKERAVELYNMLWWMIHDGQQYNEPLDYGKLPPAAVTVAEKILRSIVYQGKPVK